MSDLASGAVDKDEIPFEIQACERELRSGNFPGPVELSVSVRCSLLREQLIICWIEVPGVPCLVSEHFDAIIEEPDRVGPHNNDADLLGAEGSSCTREYQGAARKTELGCA